MYVEYRPTDQFKLKKTQVNILCFWQVFYKCAEKTTKMMAQKRPLIVLYTKYTTQKLQLYPSLLSKRVKGT